MSRRLPTDHDGDRHVLFRATAALLFLGVALGAFGAHGLRARFDVNGLGAVWETAVLYHLVHGAALLTLATLRPVPRGPWALLAAGVLVFSGSLYLLAFTGARWLGAITPIGGVCFLAGWAWLALAKGGRTTQEKEDPATP